MNRTQARGGRPSWVVHAGALGDFVLIWPFIRGLVAAGREVTVVAAPSKAALCAAELGTGPISSLSLEQPRFTRIWQGSAGVQSSDRVEGVADLFTFLADPSSEPGRRWIAGASAMFPGARVIPIGPPGSASREAAWHSARATHEDAAAEPRANEGGPITLHVGAGSPAKRWSMDRWHALFTTLAATPGPSSSCQPQWLGVRLIAGEVEFEQFGSAERRLFAAMDGRYIVKLGELASAIKLARLFVGADSGPTHLAAQLGVRTLALFGPTDPRLWSPVGPQVRVLAPVTLQAMSWLAPPEVVSRIAALDAARPHEPRPRDQ